MASSTLLSVSDIAYCHFVRLNAFIMCNPSFLHKAAQFDVNDGYRDETHCIFKSLYRTIVSSLVWRHLLCDGASSAAYSEQQQMVRVASLSALLLDAATGGLTKSLQETLNFRARNIVAVTRQKSAAVRMVQRGLSNVICGQLDAVWRRYGDICDLVKGDDCLPRSFSLVADDRMGHFSREQEAILRYHVAPLLQNRSIYTLTISRARARQSKATVIAKVVRALRLGGRFDTDYVVDFSYNRVYETTRGAPMTSLFFVLTRRDALSPVLPPKYDVDTACVPVIDGDLDLDAAALHLQDVFDGPPTRNAESLLEMAERRLHDLQQRVREWLSNFDGDDANTTWNDMTVVLADIHVRGTLLRDDEGGTPYMAIDARALESFVTADRNVEGLWKICEHLELDEGTKCYKIF